MIKKPKNPFKYWGLYCWHAYSTNPKLIEIQASSDNKEYVSFGAFDVIMKPGRQFFVFPPVPYKKKLNYVKIIIKETYGGDRTYLNQIFFFDEKAILESNLIRSANGDKNLNEGQSFFNSDNYKEEEELSYEPIAPTEKVERLYTKNDEDLGENVLTTNKPEIDNEEEEELDSEEEREKEKKLKKIQKILKSKNIPSTRQKILNKRNKSDASFEENDVSDDTTKKNSTISYNLNRPQISSRLMSRIKNATMNNNTYYSNNETFEKTTSTPYSYAATISNLQKRIMTPLPRTPKHISKSPLDRIQISGCENNNNDTEYAKLENQIKEMEDQLKSMNANSNINNININNTTTDSATKNLVHSKSFSFLQKDFKVPKQNISGFTRNDALAQYLSNQSDIPDNPLQSDSRNDIKTIIPQSSNSRANEYKAQIQSLNFGGDESNEKIKAIENKLAGLEEELKEIRQSFTKITENIQAIAQQAQKESAKKQEEVHRESNMDEILDITLKECAKMINNKFQEFSQNQTMNNNYPSSHYQNYPGTGYDSNGVNINLSTDSNLNSFEMRLNKKIEEKLEMLSSNIQNQFFKDYLHPYIQDIENVMKTNLDEIKEKVNSLNNNFNQSETSSFVESYRCNKSVQSSQYEVGKSTQRRQEKYDEINRIGEKLYDKLIEKEKKLKDLKVEATNYFKVKLKNDGNRYSKLSNNN